LLVKTASGSTLASCAALCSNLRVGIEDSCNIYYVENGLCKAGVLDNSKTYSKPAGSSITLVQVQVLKSAKSGSLGTHVKPGKIQSLLLQCKLERVNLYSF
jgi:hypothetical protein